MRGGAGVPKLVTVAAFAMLALSCSETGAPEPAKPRGLPITAAERALASAVFELDITKRAPDRAPWVGGTGLDFAAVLQEEGSAAPLRHAVDLLPAEAVIKQATNWGAQRRIHCVAALLDHVDYGVRRHALRTLRNTRQPRVVPALIAAAKHNAFALVEGEQRAQQEQYRRELADAIKAFTKIKPYQGPPPVRSRHGEKIFTFDFGSLDRWIETEVLDQSHWPK